MASEKSLSRFDGSLADPFRRRLVSVSETLRTCPSMALADPMGSPSYIICVTTTRAFSMPFVLIPCATKKQAKTRTRKPRAKSIAYTQV